METEPVLQLRAADGGDGDDAVSSVSAGGAGVSGEAGAESDGGPGCVARPAAGVRAAVLPDASAAGAAVPAGVSSPPRPRESWAVKAARLDGLLADPGLCATVCERLAEGETVAEIAAAWDIPAGRLRRWLLDDETRYGQYRRARQLDAHRLVEEAVAIADRASVEDKAGVMKAKLQVDTRFRTAAYHDRETYGDTAGKGGGTQVNVIVQRQQTTAPVSQPAIETTATETTTPSSTQED